MLGYHQANAVHLSGAHVGGTAGKHAFAAAAIRAAPCDPPDLEEIWFLE